MLNVMSDVFLDVTSDVMLFTMSNFKLVFMMDVMLYATVDVRCCVRYHFIFHRNNMSCQMLHLMTYWIFQLFEKKKKAICQAQTNQSPSFS